MIKPVKARYIILILLAAAVLALVLTRLVSFGPEPPKKIVVAVKATEDIDFWRVLTDGVHTAAREFGAEVSVIGPPQEIEVDLQIAQLKKAIEQKPDAILLAASDYERLVPVADAIRKAGILLVSVDSGINADYARSFICTDNVDAGEKAGRELASLLPPKAKVAIISYVQGTSTQIDREKGVRSVIGNRPGTEIVGTFYSEGREEKAYEVTKKLLREHGDLDGIIGLNEPSTVGAGRAIKDMNASDRVQLVGFDSSIEEVKLLEEGILSSTIVQKPFNMGYLGIKTTMSLLNGEKAPPIVYTDSVVIDKDNIYTEENQKLLFPFVEE